MAAKIWGARVYVASFSIAVVLVLFSFPSTPSSAEKVEPKRFLQWYLFDYEKDSHIATMTHIDDIEEGGKRIIADAKKEKSGLVAVLFLYCDRAINIEFLNENFDPAYGVHNNDKWSKHKIISKWIIMDGLRRKEIINENLSTRQ